jgi:high-affinity iron transporter
MGQVLFVVWRESVEALLVVGILHAWLTHADTAPARRGLPYLWAGVAAGLLAAAALGSVLLGFSEFLAGDAADFFQTGMVLVACGLIVQMVLWMKRHGRTLKRDMEGSLQAHTRTDNGWGIAILAALAVAREGSETVVFLYGLGLGQPGRFDVTDLLAIALGLGLAFLTFWLLQLGGRVFTWRRFFRVTEIMLLFLAAGLLQTGVDKLIDREILPVGIAQLWNTSAILSDSSTLGSLIAALTGYRAHPSLTNVIAYLLYWVLVGWLMRRASRTPAATVGRAA